MRNYEVTFIVDPVLSSDEIKSTLNTYTELLKSEGCSIVHIEEMGLRPLSYPINSRTTGVYYCIEFTSENGNLINRFELALHRDERIMRFLTLALDRYGVQYNEDKRAGKIGLWRKKREEEQAKELEMQQQEQAKNEAARAAKSKSKAAAAEAKKEAATAVAEAPVAEAPVAEAPVAEAPAVEAVTEAAEPIAEATPTTETIEAPEATETTSEDTTNENTES